MQISGIIQEILVISDSQHFLDDTTECRLLSERHYTGKNLSKSYQWLLYI